MSGMKLVSIGSCNKKLREVTVVVVAISIHITCKVLHVRRCHDGNQLLLVFNAPSRQPRCNVCCTSPLMPTCCTRLARNAECSTMSHHTPVPSRAIRGSGISVSSTLPPLNVQPSSAPKPRLPGGAPSDRTRRRGRPRTPSTKTGSQPSAGVGCARVGGALRQEPFWCFINI